MSGTSIQVTPDYPVWTAEALGREDVFYGAGGHQCVYDTHVRRALLGENVFPFQSRAEADHPQLAHRDKRSERGVHVLSNCMQT